MTETERKPSGRGKAVLAIDWWPGALPEGTVVAPRTIVAHDGEVSRATLYSRGNPTSAFCLMHPRQDLQRHPLIPRLVEAGHAVWAAASRVVGNDLTLIHEHVLLDVAAGMETLRDEGFESITLVGISGGAGLYAFYTEQSQASSRLERLPSGAPSGLADAPMPVPDALTLIAPHPGQGRLLLAMIDPMAEGLDPYDPANGFSEEGSHFAADWLGRYRQAQRARVQSIDDHARALLKARRAAVIETWQTDADPRCTDLSLDANDRRIGSVIHPKPWLSNKGLGGFGLRTTPEAWLSTWSWISSNAAVERCLAGVTVPTKIIEYTGDQSVFPSDIAAALGAAGDAAHVQIRSSHFGKRLSREDEDPIELTAAALLS